MRYIHIDKEKIGIEEVWEVGKGRKVKVESEVLKRVKEYRKKLEKKLKNGGVFYGVNTGVGRLADKVLTEKELDEFQVDLVNSHSAGWGESLNKEIVRMAMFLRLYMLSKGYSGVREEVILKLEEFLNKDIVPYVPKLGSVGASGDLAPLSHIALALTGGGKVHFNDRVLPTYLVLKITNTKPLKLKFKEALSLFNGTQISLATLIYSLKYLEKLLEIYDISYLLSFVAIDGKKEIFDRKLLSLRNSKYELEISRKYLNYLKDYKPNQKRKIVQDPYSFRCMPQVRGTCQEIIEFSKKLIEDEIQAVTDNPLFIDNKVISGGNFVGIRVSFACENLKKVVQVLSNISERRINHLMGSDVIEMPPFLSREPGKKSGLMLLQVLCASLVSYNKSLTFPDLSDSIPTSGNQEDYVPMTMNSCLKFLEMLKNFEGIVFSEFYASVRANLLLEKKLPDFLFNFIESNFSNKNIFLNDNPPYEVLNKIREVLMKDF